MGELLALGFPMRLMQPMPRTCSTGRIGEACERLGSRLIRAVFGMLRPFDTGLHRRNGLHCFSTRVAEGLGSKWLKSTYCPMIARA